MRAGSIFLIIIFFTFIPFLASNSQFALKAQVLDSLSKKSNIQSPSEDTIQALVLIMDSTEYQNLLNLPESEWKERYCNFWKLKDPTPDTHINELEQEYLNRLNIANQYFSQLGDEISGWQSDRGRILILYGKPNQIENPKTEDNVTVKYEIWTYNRLNKRFIFKKESKSNRYYLLTED